MPARCSARRGRAAVVGDGERRDAGRLVDDPVTVVVAAVDADFRRRADLADAGGAPAAVGAGLASIDADPAADGVHRAAVAGARLARAAVAALVDHPVTVLVDASEVADLGAGLSEWRREAVALGAPDAAPRARPGAVHAGAARRARTDVRRGDGGVGHGVGARVSAGRVGDAEGVGRGRRVRARVGGRRGGVRDRDTHLARTRPEAVPRATDAGERRVDAPPAAGVRDVGSAALAALADRRRRHLVGVDTLHRGASPDGREDGRHEGGAEQLNHRQTSEDGVAGSVSSSANARTRVPQRTKKNGFCQGS